MDLELSIIIPAYNYAHFLPQAIDSILAQNFSSMELIIIDDASTDNTFEIVQEYQKKTSNIRAFQHEKNQGLLYTINESIDLAKGRYLHWLAADDFREASFVKKSMDALLAHPFLDISCSDYGYAEEAKGRDYLLSKKLIEGINAPRTITPQQLIKLLRSTNFWIPGHTTIVKKEAVIRSGKFKDVFQEKCDWFLSYRIALENGIIYIPETLSYIYQHSASYSAHMGAQKKLRKNAARALLDFLQLPENRHVKRLFYKSTLLTWACKDLPFEFLKIKHWEATFFFVLKKLERYGRLIRRQNPLRDPTTIL